jgi:hypothetical protein
MVDSWIEEEVHGSDGINIGDWVTVSNHGIFFPQAQVKEIDFSKNLAKVKWEISCTTDFVEIANLHPYFTSTISK